MDENKKTGRSIYFRIKDLAVDENGQPDDAYAELALPPELSDRLPEDYGEMTKKTDPYRIMSAFGLESVARNHECEIITPEEYQAAMAED